MPGSSGARRRPRGIAVRPEAVRQARLELGLSLTELAGGQVTRAAIHLVETGKMRPSMRTLQLIAKRTGRPIAYFLAGEEGSEELRAARDELLSLVDANELQAAVDLATDLLRERLEPGIEADVRLAFGRALFRLLDGEAALAHLARARWLFDRIGDAWMAAHAMAQEGFAMFLVEDTRALQRSLEALDRCDRLEPPDPALRATVLGLLGNICMRAHDWRNAARFFAMGLEASEAVVDLRQAARLHDGLSAAQQEIGDFGAALRSAERASALYAVDSSPLSRMRSENNLGYVLLRQGELDAAGVHLHRALELCDEHNVERIGRTRVLSSLGELYLAREEPGRAMDYLRKSVEVALRTSDREAEATARHLMARASLLLGDEESAHEFFAATVELLQHLRLPERLRECSAEYADLLHRQGRLEESIGYWRIAAAAQSPLPAGSRETVAQLSQSGA